MAFTAHRKSSAEISDKDLKDFILHSGHRTLLSSRPIDHESSVGDRTPGSLPLSSFSRSVEQSGPPTPVQGEPQNFGSVHTGLYRSSFPLPCNLEHLSTLNLRTIVTLVAAPYPPEYQGFIESQGINHYQIEFPPHKTETDCIPLESMRKVLSILHEEANYPLLVHCNKGKHRTGCAIACYRLISGKPLEEALDEYRRYAGSKARVLDELYIQSIELEAISPVKPVGRPPKTTKPPPSIYPTPPSSDRSPNLETVDL